MLKLLTLNCVFVASFIKIFMQMSFLFSVLASGSS